jgi:hypothetical protein
VDEATTVMAGNLPCVNLPALPQSIFLKGFLGNAMDTRVEPAYDIVIRARHVQFATAITASVNGKAVVHDKSKSSVSER